jgi:hypothetical protein
MRVTTMKSGVSISFCRKLAIYEKTVRWHLCILSENLKFSKSRKKTHIGDHYVQLIRNMGFMTKKYGVSDSFCCKLAIYEKAVG